jgi:hypothetical protein
MATSRDDWYDPDKPTDPANPNGWNGIFNDRQSAREATTMFVVLLFTMMVVGFLILWGWHAMG